MPTFLQDFDSLQTPQWFPDSQTVKEKAQDEELIQDALDQRSRHEERWTWAASRWNLLVEPIDDPRLSNILLPFIRMIGSTAISSLSGAHRKNRYKPRQRTDDPKAMLWQGASDHIDNACGMSNELDDFYTNFVVLGTAALEDYVHIPHINKRYKKNAEWENVPVRDFTRSRIGTRSRTPWSFGFWTGNRDPNEFAPVFTRDYYSFNHFVQEFASVCLPDGSPKYENCEYVLPGKQCILNRTTGLTEYEQMDHDGVSVITIQDPIRDIQRKYANGVRIQNIALHDYNRIQKTTLSIAQNNHQYDGSLQESSAYGMGDTHLLQGLDALYQAIGNLNIDNYKLANTNLISIRSNNGATAIDQDFEYLSGVRVDGDVIVSPMGTVRLGEYQGFKEMIDQWAKWTVKVPFDQLNAQNTSGTAFELQQQIRDGMRGTEYKAAKLAGNCFRKHAKNRLSFILSDMTVEEYMDLEEAEIPQIMELLKKKKAPKEDYEYNDGRPTRRIIREKVMIKNRDIQETYTEGKRSVDELKDAGPAEFDSEVTVAGSTFWPLEYIESGAIPDIEVEIDLGAERDLRFSKMQFISNYARQRIAEAATNPGVEALQTKFDGKKLDDELIRSIEGLSKDSVMASDTVDDDVENADAAISQIEKLISPQNNVQPQAPVSVSNVDAGGLGSFGTEPNQSANPVANAEGVALGAA